MPPPPGALLVLLAVLALGAGASVQACPTQCECAESTSFDLTCRRAQGEGRVWLEGARTQYLNIHCLQKDTKNFTCDDIPEFDFGRNGTLEGLSFHSCPLASLSIACVARRVRARAVLNLTVYYSPGGPQLLPGNVERLQGVRRLFLRGRDEIDEEVTIPSEALALFPTLERFTIQSAWVRLTPGALTGLHALTRLEISMARLRELPAGAIADLPALTELSLFRNDIENITQDTFQNLTSLDVLDVSSNQLSALNGTALAAGCPRLREIYAYNNPLLTMLPLEPLHLLEKLEIFDCDLEKSLNLTSRALGGLSRLTDVTLRSCHILELPEDLLTGSTSLRSLNLGDNSLRELPANLFADQRALQELDLSENQLETLPQELFWRLTKLQRLNLEENHLLELPDRFVEGLPLRALSVARNHLRRLRSTTFAGAGALEHLDLSRNQLANAPASAEGEYALLGTPSPFNALLQLRTLNLSHNVLSELYQDIPLTLLSLLSLDMSHNNISYVTDQDNTLTFLGPNVTVDLRNNNISRVDLSPPLWPAHADPEYASRVMLARNPFHCDCRLDALARRLRGFAGPATLPAMEVGDADCANPPALRGRRFVDIDMHDLICELPSNSCVPNCDCVGRSQIIAMECKSQFDSFPQDFKYFPSELKLRFTPSYLSWIPSTVKTLDLSDLSMTEVPTDLNTSAIKHVDLRGNSLTEVPVDILKANITMKLSRNPLACDCWHTEGVRQLKAYSALVKDYEDLTCADGFSVQNVNAEQLCRTFMLVAFGVVLALLGVAFIVATVIYLRYSLQLKVFLYSRGWCGCWVREEDLDKDKKFDAFITYSESDKSFVHNILQPCLEGGPRPFKLCIHHRDWVVGEWIPAQIAESVEQSRRTIVVLSKNFLESMWSRLEFRAANMSAVKEKRSRVIVILLEDVANHKELDAELKAYLATNTYLKWGDPWFWEKLRYALPHRAEEARMRKQGGRLAHLMQGGGGGLDKYKGSDGPLDVKFAPNGKILHAAIKASPDQKLASAVKAMPI